MRRLLFVVCTVLAAASVVSFSNLAAEAQSADQYGSSDGAQAPQVSQQDTQEKTAPEDRSGALPSQEDMIVEGSVSQGSVADPDSPEAIAAREDLAEEEALPAYSQVVDNSTKGAFRAPGWKVERGSLSHEGSFVAANGKKAARFSIKIPSSSDYSVYVWWPGVADAGTARYGVQTASGTEWTKVEQDKSSSGMWVKLGSFAMEEGQRSVGVAAKPVDGGRVIADAIAVVRGDAAPPEDQAMTVSGERATDFKSLSRFSGRDVVRQARRHKGDRYRWGTCTRTVKSCTCLTKKAVSPFGHRLGMDEVGQWRYERSRKIDKSNLRPGDEVFFKENGRNGPITHVGIYSGNGNIVHASAYFGKVVEKKMKYINGYYGAKRFKSR